MKYLKSLILVLIFSTSYGQIEANKLGKEFFTTENMKLAISLGGDLTSIGENGQTGLIKPKGTIAKNQLSFGEPNSSYSFGFDIYSSQSKLGFFIDPTYNVQNYSITARTSSIRDSLTVSNLEIPVYLKLRLGNPVSRSQFWWAVGGGYSIPLNARQNYFNKETNSYITTLENKEMFNSIIYLSTIIGYELNLAFSESDKEMYERDGVKILLYAKTNYDLGNRLNQDYNFGTNTSLGTIANPTLKFLRVSFGIKLLLRISKVLDIANDLSKEVTKPKS